MEENGNEYRPSVTIDMGPSVGKVVVLIFFKKNDIHVHTYMRKEEEIKNSRNPEDKDSKKALMGLAAGGVVCWNQDPDDHHPTYPMRDGTLAQREVERDDWFHSHPRIRRVRERKL